MKYHNISNLINVIPYPLEGGRTLNSPSPDVYHWFALLFAQCPLTVVLDDITSHLQTSCLSTLYGELVFITIGLFFVQKWLA